MIFDPLTAGTLLILAASPVDKLCDMPQPTEIEVLPQADPIEYDYSQTLEDLSGVETDTINPYGFDGISIPEGYMKSPIRMRPEVELSGKSIPSMGAACVWYDRITIRLEIKPQIVIASEIADDDCMYEAVKNHEMKHVRALRKLVNKYAESMGREVYDELQQRGFSSGVIPQEHAEQIGTRMQKTVGQILELQFKKMEIENAEVQGEVDSLEEYKYVNSLCPDFKLDKNGRRSEDD